MRSCTPQPRYRHWHIQGLWWVWRWEHCSLSVRHFMPKHSYYGMEWGEYYSLSESTVMIWKLLQSTLCAAIVAVAKRVPVTARAQLLALQLSLSPSSSVSLRATCARAEAARARTRSVAFMLDGLDEIGWVDLSECVIIEAFRMRMIW